MVYSPAFTFSSVYSLGFCRVPGFALGCCASFKRFWPLALVEQALPAIILQALRRLRGALLFRGLHPSSSWGFPCWLLGLTVQSSRPAFGGRLTFGVRPLRNRFIQAMLYSPAFTFSSVYSLGFLPCGGLRLGLIRFFKPFRPLAFVQQALVAIILQALRCFRGAAIFRSVRPSSSCGFPRWPLGLTVQSSCAAFCGRLTFGR